MTMNVNISNTSLVEWLLSTDKIRRNVLLNNVGSYLEEKGQLNGDICKSVLKLYSRATVNVKRLSKSQVLRYSRRKKYAKTTDTKDSHITEEKCKSLHNHNNMLHSSPDSCVRSNECFKITKPHQPIHPKPVIENECFLTDITSKESKCESNDKAAQIAVSDLEHALSSSDIDTNNQCGVTIEMHCKKRSTCNVAESKCSENKPNVKDGKVLQEVHKHNFTNNNEGKTDSNSESVQTITTTIQHNLNRDESSICVVEEMKQDGKKKIDGKKSKIIYPIKLKNKCFKGTENKKGHTYSHEEIELKMLENTYEYQQKNTNNYLNSKMNNEELERGDVGREKYKEELEFKICNEYSKNKNVIEVQKRNNFDEVDKNHRLIVTEVDYERTENNVKSTKDGVKDSICKSNIFDFHRNKDLQNSVAKRIEENINTVSDPKTHNSDITMSEESSIVTNNEEINLNGSSKILEISSKTVSEKKSINFPTISNLEKIDKFKKQKDIADKHIRSETSDVGKTEMVEIGFGHQGQDRHNAKNSDLCIDKSMTFAKNKDIGFGQQEQDRDNPKNSYLCNEGMAVARKKDIGFGQQVQDRDNAKNSYLRNDKRMAVARKKDIGFGQQEQDRDNAKNSYLCNDKRIAVSTNKNVGFGQEEQDRDNPKNVDLYSSQTMVFDTNKDFKNKTSHSHNNVTSKNKTTESNINQTVKLQTALKFKLFNVLKGSNTHLNKIKRHLARDISSLTLRSDTSENTSNEKNTILTYSISGKQESVNKSPFDSKSGATDHLQSECEMLRTNDVDPFKVNLLNEQSKNESSLINNINAERKGYNCYGTNEKKQQLLKPNNETINKICQIKFNTSETNDNGAKNGINQRDEALESHTKNLETRKRIAETSLSVSKAKVRKMCVELSDVSRISNSIVDIEDNAPTNSKELANDLNILTNNRTAQGITQQIDTISPGYQFRNNIKTKPNLSLNKISKPVKSFVLDANSFHKKGNAISEQTVLHNTFKCLCLLKSHSDDSNCNCVVQGTVPITAALLSCDINSKQPSKKLDDGSNHRAILKINENIIESRQRQIKHICDAVSLYITYFEKNANHSTVPQEIQITVQNYLSTKGNHFENPSIVSDVTKFLYFYDIHFDVVRNNAIKTMAEVLHLAIADYFHREEQIKFAMRLNSDIRNEEIKRANNDYGKILHLRGVKFFDLLQLLTKNIENDKNLLRATTIYFKINQALLEINLDNLKYLGMVRNLMKSLLDRTNFEQVSILNDFFSLSQTELSRRYNFIKKCVLAYDIAKYGLLKGCKVEYPFSLKYVLFESTSNEIKKMVYDFLNKNEYISKKILIPSESNSTFNLIQERKHLQDMLIEQVFEDLSRESTTSSNQSDLISQNISRACLGVEQQKESFNNREITMVSGEKNQISHQRYASFNKVRQQSDNVPQTMIQHNAKGVKMYQHQNFSTTDQQQFRKISAEPQNNQSYIPDRFITLRNSSHDQSDIDQIQLQKNYHQTQKWF